MTYYIMDISFIFYDELNNINDTADTNDNNNNQNDINNDNSHDSNNENVCLISNLPLDETAVTLPCQHKFNYYYIFNEVLNSKKKNHNIYSSSSKLAQNEIKCPYCRTIYDNLLPLPLDIIGVYKCDAVNSPNYQSFKIECKEPECKYSKTPSENVNLFEPINYHNNKVYVTPLGYYCKKHYTHNKKKYEKDNHQNKNNISKNNELINENWISSKWNKYTIDQLKIVLKENKLKVSGKKALLITRLINNNILPDSHDN